MLVILSIVLSALLQGGLNCNTHTYSFYGSFPVSAGDVVFATTTGSASIWIGDTVHLVIGSGTIQITEDGLLEAETLGKDPHIITLQHCSPQPSLPSQPQLPISGLAGFLPLFFFIVISLGIGAMFRSAR